MLRHGYWILATTGKVTYNNSFQNIINMAPCEFLYGGNWRSPIHWDEEGEKRVLGPKIVERMVQVIDKIRV